MSILVNALVDYSQDTRSNASWEKLISFPDCKERTQNWLNKHNLTSLPVELHNPLTGEPAVLEVRSKVT
jgi:hypothetical protein